MNLYSYLGHPSAFADVGQYLPSKLEEAAPIDPVRVDTSWSDLRSIRNACVWDGNGRRVLRGVFHRTNYLAGIYTR